MKKTHIWITILFTNILLTFAGCGAAAPDAGAAGDAIGGTAGPTVTLNSTISGGDISDDDGLNTTTPNTPYPQTEEEFRQAIASLTGDEFSLTIDESTLTGEETSPQTDTSTLSTLQDYYEKLLAMDVFTEEDYVALAAVYAAQGMQEAQADMLTKTHRLYPSTEHIAALSALVWDKDSSDTLTASLVAQMLTAIEAEDQAAAAALTASEDWQNQLQNELVGVVTKTRYTTGGQTTYITSDSFATEVMSLASNGTFAFFQINSQGSTLIQATLVDGSYQGDFIMSLFDAEGDLIHRYAGTLKNDICVGELQITYSGNTYTGEFDEQGHALADQIPFITKEDGVVYAYNKNKTAYLYEKNVSVDTFTIDSAYLNLPVFKEW